MHILWLKHPYQPELNGTEEHVARSVAENAVQFKQAEYVVAPNRNDPKWLAWRKAQMAAVTAPGPEDTAVPFVNGVVWAVGTSRYGYPVITWRSGFESTQWDPNVVPANCPAEVRKHYEATIKEHSARELAKARERERALASGARYSE